MRVHELIVTHFRGIQALEWRPAPGLTCLIGPGDSTKSTIIDSLSLLLAAGWNTQFTDADFTNGDVSQEVVISATLTDLSDELLANDVFGMSLRGIGPDGTIHDDPLPKCEPAITLELRVDASLEPSWSVLKESDEPRRITGRARELIAAARLDQAVDPHLRWGRATALTRLTGPAPDVPFTLAESHRAARSAVFENPDPALQAAASTAREAAASTGAVRLGPLRPGLDPSVYSRVGSLNGTAARGGDI